jgi:anti-sigma factor ChrR (cupin superfamily)
MSLEPRHRDEHDEWPALYAAGALEPDERISFENHVAAGCQICSSRLSDFEAVTAQLIEVVSEQPPASLRSSLMDRIQQEVSLNSAKMPPGILLEQAGLFISRSDEIAWVPTPLPGVKIKSLYVDSARKYLTSLVSLEAGATYPAHRHGDVEEFYVLQGELFGEGINVRAGDYCRSEPGSIHGDAKTDAGALLLVWSSHSDKLI